jgi:hypothetical protein
LTCLHGELLAHGWIEINIGRIQSLRPGTVPQCYRATPTGRRALTRAEDSTELNDQRASVIFKTAARPQAALFGITAFDGASR